MNHTLTHSSPKQNRITLSTGVKLRAVKPHNHMDGCRGCRLYDDDLVHLLCTNIPCYPSLRVDKQRIIFKEIK